MVIVYGKENCAQCKMTKTVMQREGIDFVEKDIEKDDNSLEYLREVFIGGVSIILPLLKIFSLSNSIFNSLPSN